MSRSVKVRIGAIGASLLLTGALVVMATGATGAYFSDSKQGEITGSTGSIRVDTSGGSGANGLTFTAQNLLPGEPQTATVGIKNVGHNPQDVWVVFDNAAALHALNNLGRYGEVTLSNSGGVIFHSANLNDNLPPASGTCGEFNPAGCWPLGTKYKVASNVSPGASSWFKFQFGYTTYKGGIGNSQEEMPFNSYPPEVEPGEVEGSGLPYEVVATQVGVEP
ncbi:MAG TPA: hypothetical protein VGI17_16475 [Solirubrobacterales bacterium]